MPDRRKLAVQDIRMHHPRTTPREAEAAGLALYPFDTASRPSKELDRAILPARKRFRKDLKKSARYGGMATGDLARWTLQSYEKTARRLGDRYYEERWGEMAEPEPATQAPPGFEGDTEAATRQTLLDALMESGWDFHWAWPAAVVLHPFDPEVEPDPELAARVLAARPKFASDLVTTMAAFPEQAAELVGGAAIGILWLCHNMAVEFGDEHYQNEWEWALSGYERPERSEPTPSPAIPPPPPADPKPDWLPDPRGRHDYRYWDGGAWTEHVSDAGAEGTDPV